MSDLNSLHNRTVWVDIPVADLARAVAFYRGVLSVDVGLERFGETEFAVLAHDQGNGGCLVVQPDEIRGDAGILVYLNADGRLRDAVAKTRELGGEVLQDIHAIGPHGSRAIIRDSEGNRLALHSNEVF